jgi:hypothetical protein
MKIKTGDKIRTKYQNWYTVMNINGKTITVYETNNKIHKSNIVEVK